MHSSYATIDQLDTQLDLPASLALASLASDSWLVLGTVVLTAPQTLTLRWLQLAILGSFGTNTSVVPNPTTGLCVFPSPSPTEVNLGRGLAWLGIYAGFDPLTSPVLQTAIEAVVTIPLPSGSIVTPTVATRPLASATYATPGTYTVVVYNNAAGYQLQLTVSGALRVCLGTPTQ